MTAPEPALPPSQNQHWSQSAAGSYILQWERRQYDAAVVSLFGYYALQVGGATFHALAENRMPHRWLALQNETALPEYPADLQVDYHQLPFDEGSIDLLALPHTLEESSNPHATLRDAARALVPGGKLIISGFHTPSLWYSALGRKRVERLAFPHQRQLIAHKRLLDWLTLLGLKVETLNYGCYRPLRSSAQRFERLAFLENWGSTLWPNFGAVYFLLASKQVLGSRMISPQWSHSLHSPATAPAALQQDTHPHTKLHEPDL